MIRSSHAELCKDNNSVKLQGAPLDRNPRKLPVGDSWIIILQNNSKCLVLNDKQTPHEILFSLLEEIQNTEKMHTRIERKKTWKKVREIRWVFFNIYVVVFAYLLSSVGEVGW